MFLRNGLKKYYVLFASISALETGLVVYPTKDTLYSGLLYLHFEARNVTLNKPFVFMQKSNFLKGCIVTSIPTSSFLELLHISIPHPSVAGKNHGNNRFNNYLVILRFLETSSLSI